MGFASGDNVWGNSKVGHHLGNPLGKNSHIYNSYDNQGLDVIRGGAKIYPII